MAAIVGSHSAFALAYLICAARLGMVPPFNLAQNPHRLGIFELISELVDRQRPRPQPKRAEHARLRHTITHHQLHRAAV
jgi:hypothetical protein